MPREKYIQTVVYLNKELADWLETKTEEGYSKSALIRRAISIYKDCKPAQKDKDGHGTFVDGHGE